MKKAMEASFIALFLAFLAACETSGGGATVAPNPADLVRKAGAVPPPGSVVGEVDSGGFRINSGEFPGTGETIDVRTFGGPVAPDPTFGTYSADSDPFIRGAGFIAELHGVFESGNVVFPVTPEVVAKRLDGNVAPPLPCTAPGQAGCGHH